MQGGSAQSGTKVEKTSHARRSPHVHFRAQRLSARTGLPRSEERRPRAWQAEALAPLSAAALGLSGQGPRAFWAGPSEGGSEGGVSGPLSP